MTESNPISEGPVRRRSFLRKGLSVARVVVINFIVFAIIAELGCLLYINLTDWPSSKPSYHLSDNWFWVDINPVFGVWHRPNGHFVHKGGCFTVEYNTNSYGARDVERSLHSTRSRTVMLGDSFVEGVGVPDKDRLSNILERDTGREHLNFATGGDFGPLQYALLYKTMASAFDHDLVLVGVLPDNDFRDMSLSYGRIHHPGRYRPYYTDDFSVVYEGQLKPNGGEGFWDQVEAALRAYLASYQVGQYLYTRLYWYRRSYNPYSGYNDYDDVDLSRLKRALEDIKSTADAHGARMAVFLIPRTIDLQRLHQAGTNRLGPVMERWGHDAGIPIKDLMPEMDARSNGDYQSYFLSCDGHWSARGSTAAAEILEPWLGEKKGS
jgi:hypothetical protein